MISIFSHKLYSDEVGFPQHGSLDEYDPLAPYRDLQEALQRIVEFAGSGEDDVVPLQDRVRVELVQEILDHVHAELFELLQQFTEL